MTVPNPIDPEGPIRCMSATEFNAKVDACIDKRRQAIRDAEVQCAYELDLIDINYYGPRWLTDGLVGRWDE